MRHASLEGLVSGGGPLGHLARACHDGRLVGGLSVARAATPDELVGHLTGALGGAARGLKVLDVRVGDPMTMEVRWGERHETWEVADLEALVEAANELFARDATVAAAAVLGEWEDMLQLWCVPKARLVRLLQGGVLTGALNRHTLERLASYESRSTRRSGGR